MEDMIKEFKLEILEDPKVFMQNRLKAHSNHKYFANHKEALENQSSFRQLLNGTWRFKFDTCVEEAVAREALRLAMHKLPIKCKFVKKESGEAND